MKQPTDNDIAALRCVGYSAIVAAVQIVAPLSELPEVERRSREAFNAAIARVAGNRQSAACNTWSCANLYLAAQLRAALAILEGA